jgi:hypothetical protein
VGWDYSADNVQPVQRVADARKDGDYLQEDYMENKDIKLTLQYNLDEINHILTLLGSLPFTQSAMVINSIQAQVMPQIPAPEEKNDQENN